MIVVGEMCDAATIATALTAAETGHLVFGTLHTRNAPSTVLRIVDQFPAQRHDHVRSMLASTLKAIVVKTTHATSPAVTRSSTGRDMRQASDVGPEGPSSASSISSGCSPVGSC